MEIEARKEPTRLANLTATNRQQLLARPLDLIHFVKERRAFLEDVRVFVEHFAKLRNDEERRFVVERLLRRQRYRRVEPIDDPLTFAPEILDFRRAGRDLRSQIVRNLDASEEIANLLRFERLGQTRGAQPSAPTFKRFLNRGFRARDLLLLSAEKLRRFSPLRFDRREPFEMGKVRFRALETRLKGKVRLIRRRGVLLVQRGCLDARLLKLTRKKP